MKKGWEEGDWRNERETDGGEEGEEGAESDDVRDDSKWQG